MYPITEQELVFLYISAFPIFSAHLALCGEYALHIDVQIFPGAAFGLFSFKKSFGFSDM